MLPACGLFMAGQQVGSGTKTNLRKGKLPRVVVFFFSQKGTADQMERAKTIFYDNYRNSRALIGLFLLSICRQT